MEEDNPSIMRFFISEVRTPLQRRNEIVSYLNNRREDHSDALSIIERRLRRRRAVHYIVNELGESEDDTTEKENIPGFRSYPLNIDWKDIYSYDNDSYEILKLYGYIGVFFYSETIKNFEFIAKPKPEEFPLSFLILYCRFYQLNDEHARLIVEIISKNIDRINQIIIMGLFSSKEILITKLILDIILHFSTDKQTYLLHDFFVNKVIPTIILFYSSLTETEIENLYDTIYKTKKLKEILSNKTN